MPLRDLAVNGKRIGRRLEAPCDIVRERTGISRVAHADRQRRRDRCELIAGAHLIAVRQVPVYGLPAAKLQRDLCRAIRQGFRRRRHHIRHIARRTVQKRRRHDHAGFVKDFTGVVLRLIWLLCDLDLLNASTERHQITRVILKIDRAVAVSDRAANRVLCLLAVW